MDQVIIDCRRKYQINGQVCSLQWVVVNASVGNNRTIVSAVTGKRILTMGWILQSGGTSESNVHFKSASGGTQLTGDLRVPPYTGGANDKLPITDSGYFETSTGEGLFADVATDSLNGTLFYVTYTP